MEFILATEQIVRKVQLTPQRIIPTYFPIEIVLISCIYFKVLGFALVKIKLIWLAYKTFTFYVMNTAD